MKEDETISFFAYKKSLVIKKKNVIAIEITENTKKTSEKIHVRLFFIQTMA